MIEEPGNRQNSRSTFGSRLHKGYRHRARDRQGPLSPGSSESGKPVVVVDQPQDDLAYTVWRRMFRASSKMSVSFMRGSTGNRHASGIRVSEGGFVGAPFAASSGVSSVSGIWQSPSTRRNGCRRQRRQASGWKPPQV